MVFQAELPHYISTIEYLGNQFGKLDQTVRVVLQISHKVRLAMEKGHISFRVRRCTVNAPFRLCMSSFYRAL